MKGGEGGPRSAAIAGRGRASARSRLPARPAAAAASALPAGAALPSPPPQRPTTAPPPAPSRPPAALPGGGGDDTALLPSAAAAAGEWSPAAHLQPLVFHSPTRHTNLARRPAPRRSPLAAAPVQTACGAAPRAQRPRGFAACRSDVTRPSGASLRPPSPLRSLALILVRTGWGEESGLGPGVGGGGRGGTKSAWAVIGGEGRF